MFFWMVLFFLAAVAIVATPVCQIALLRVKCYAYGAKFMIKSKDLPSQFRGTNYIEMKPAAARHSGGKRTIRVVFIRHGQSVWNSLFNSFGSGWPMRAVKAVIRETVDFFTNPFDSVIIDSPLSAKGRKEASDLATFMRSSKGLISFDPETSVIVSSNLRRALDTALVGVGPRVFETHERIVVDSTLQEGSRNIDAQTLSTEKGKIAPMKIGTITDPDALPTILNPYLNAGNKKIGVDVYQRMDMFLVHLFGGNEAECLLPATSSRTNENLKEVIVVGHSGYFRNFFRRFLPESSTHISKKNKMQNCAVVAFDLIRHDSDGKIEVDDSSIKALYRGFG